MLLTKVQCSYVSVWKPKNKCSITTKTSVALQQKTSVALQLYKLALYNTSGEESEKLIGVNFKNQLTPLGIVSA